jgi:methionyl aminopeptidase
MIQIKTPEEIENIRASGVIVRRTLDAMRDAIVPGVTTTADLERVAAQEISRHNATSAFLGYAPPGHPPYPAWTCISVNEVVIHGIPGSRVLEPGDVVSCDVGVRLNGFYADAAWTFPVGKVSPEVDRLLHVGEEALFAGIQQAKAGNRVGDIGHAIEALVYRHGFTVVREMVGHGVGRQLHEDPQIPNYGRPGRGPLLSEGATLAIEPMVMMGGHTIEVLEDGWTIVTGNGRPAVHFEHTVAITSNGARILTQGD